MLAVPENAETPIIFGRPREGDSDFADALESRRTP